VRTAPFLFITNMAILPKSARTAAAYLGGGVARGLEKQGNRLAGMGSGLTQAVETAGQQIQTAGQKVGMLGAREEVVRTTGSQAAKTLSQNPLAAKVGGFLESVGGGVSNLGASAGQTVSGAGQAMQQLGSQAGTMGGIGKRDMGLAAAGAAMTGAFVGGMGANAGVHSLMNYFSQDNSLRQPQRGVYGGGSMPSDLQAGYIPMNTYGSPLAIKNVAYDGDIKRAQYNQGLLRAAMGPQFNGMEEGQG